MNIRAFLCYYQSKFVTVHFIPAKFGANNRVVWLSMVWLSGLCCTHLWQTPPIKFFEIISWRGRFVFVYSLGWLAKISCAVQCRFHLEIPLLALITPTTKSPPWIAVLLEREGRIGGGGRDCVCFRHLLTRGFLSIFPSGESLYPLQPLQTV